MRTDVCILVAKFRERCLRLPNDKNLCREVLQSRQTCCIVFKTRKELWMMDCREEIMEIVKKLDMKGKAAILTYALKVLREERTHEPSSDPLAKDEK